MKAVLQQEVSQLKKVLGNAKTAQNDEPSASREQPRYNHINECVNQTKTGTEGRDVSFEDVRSELARYKAIEQQKKKAAANSDDKADSLKEDRN